MSPRRVLEARIHPLQMLVRSPWRRLRPAPDSMVKLYTDADRPSYFSHSLYAFCFCRVFHPNFPEMLLTQSSLLRPWAWTEAKG